MSGKLTANQVRVLKRLGIGAYFPAGRDIVSASALERRGLATFYQAHLSFAITPAGRLALSEIKDQ